VLAMSSMIRKFFIASLVYLVLGLLAQAVTVFDVWLGFNPLAYTAVAATEQMLLVGWLTQLGLALAYDRWLLPAEPGRRQGAVEPPGEQRLNQSPGLQSATSTLLIFLLFNIGLPLAIAGQPGLALFGGLWLGAAAALGGLLQLAAGLLFVYEAWRLLRKSR
jgi:hypothetical protein